MKTFLIVGAVAFFTFSTRVANSQTVYATISSGAWNAALVAGNSPVWETFPSYAAALAATPGTGSPSTSITNPSSTHNVLIRPGHTITMGDVNRGCKGIIIQAGGKLWGSGNTADRRLQVGAGGTGFSYPLVDTVQVDGVMGGPNDPMYIESGANAQQVKVYGSGTMDIKRIRTPGGNGGAAGGVMNFDVNMDINLWQTANYALSIVYTTPAITDNYTFTIFPGKTVAIKAADGYWHNSLNVSTYGNYTYNIKGTLDVSANTQTSSNISANIVAPAPATSKISVLVDGGTIKLGTAFKADTSNTSPQSLGVLDFKNINIGTVDGSNTSNFRMGKTSDGAGGFRDLVFATDATSTLKVQVGASQVKFGVALNNNTSSNSAYVTNAGVTDIFTIALKGTIDNAPPTTKVVNRQWTISEAVAGGTVGTIGLSWVTADQAAGFDPTQTVSILRWTGTAYEPHVATVTGSGTANDPYIATATGFVAFSPFIVANVAPLPITFQSTRAYQKNGGVQVEWTTAQEINAGKYTIEKSADGSSFTDAGFVNATGNSSTVLNYSWFDAAPFAGNNFYRIKAIDIDGRFKTTAIMKVNISSGKPSLIISPNPVRGNMVNVQLGNAVKGIYKVSLYNSAGQKVFNSEIRTDGGSSTQTLQLPANIKAGNYNLQLSNGDAKFNKTIVIE